MVQVTPDNINEALASFIAQRESMTKKQDMRGRLIAALRAKPFSLEAVAAVYADVMDEEFEELENGIVQLNELIVKLTDMKRHIDSGIVLPGGPMVPQGMKPQGGGLII